MAKKEIEKKLKEKEGKWETDMDPNQMPYISSATTDRSDGRLACCISTLATHALVATNDLYRNNATGRGDGAKLNS